MMFAKYVDDNAEKFRDKIVSHEGKKELTVIWDYTNTNIEFNVLSKKFRWDAFTEKFSELISKNVKGELANTMINNFSTTGSIE